jgi:hypothetical protein
MVCFSDSYAQIPQKPSNFGLRWRSAAATPLFECSHIQSGVALRFPPQSKTMVDFDRSLKIQTINANEKSA